MDQRALFHERIEQAIDEVITACGGRKRFAGEMWPEKSQRDAHNLLDACLNPERREKLSPDQILYVLKRGRAANCHALMRFVNRASGYAEPQPVDSEDQRALIQRNFAEAVARLDDITEQARAAGIWPLRDVK